MKLHRISDPENNHNFCIVLYRIAGLYCSSIVSSQLCYSKANVMITGLGAMGEALIGSVVYWHEGAPSHRITAFAFSEYHNNDSKNSLRGIITGAHNGIVLNCIVLYCIVLYCIVLYCIVLYSILFYSIVL